MAIYFDNSKPWWSDIARTVAGNLVNNLTQKWMTDGTANDPRKQAAWLAEIASALGGGGMPGGGQGMLQPTPGATGADTGTLTQESLNRPMTTTFPTMNGTPMPQPMPYDPGNATMPQPVPYDPGNATMPQPMPYDSEDYLAQQFTPGGNMSSSAQAQPSMMQAPPMMPQQQQRQGGNAFSDMAQVLNLLNSKRFGMLGSQGLQMAMPFIQALQGQRDKAARQQAFSSPIDFRDQNTAMNRLLGLTGSGYLEPSALGHLLGGVKHLNPHQELSTVNAGDRIYQSAFDPGSGSLNQLNQIPVGMNPYQKGQLALGRGRLGLGWANHGLQAQRNAQMQQKGNWIPTLGADGKTYLLDKSSGKSIESDVPLALKDPTKPTARANNYEFSNQMQLIKGRGALILKQISALNTQIKNLSGTSFLPEIQNQISELAQQRQALYDQYNALYYGLLTGGGDDVDLSGFDTDYSSMNWGEYGGMNFEDEAVSDGLEAPPDEEVVLNYDLEKDVLEELQ
jgi:hypothetical protein